MKVKLKNTNKMYIYYLGYDQVTLTVQKIVLLTTFKTW